jgi:hypothetical protein
VTTERPFPESTGSGILEKDGETISEAAKAFGVELDPMKFAATETP